MGCGRSGAVAHLARSPAGSVVRHSRSARWLGFGRGARLQADKIKEPDRRHGCSLAMPLLQDSRPSETPPARLLRKTRPSRVWRRLVDGEQTTFRLEGLTTPLTKTQLPPVSIEIARISVARIASSCDSFSGFRASGTGNIIGSYCRRPRRIAAGQCAGAGALRAAAIPGVSLDNLRDLRYPTGDARSRGAALSPNTLRPPYWRDCARSSANTPQRKARLYAAPADEPARPAA
jgi:hypothetical protein